MFSRKIDLKMVLIMKGYLKMTQAEDVGMKEENVFCCCCIFRDVFCCCCSFRPLQVRGRREIGADGSRTQLATQPQNLLPLLSAPFLHPPDNDVYYKSVRRHCEGQCGQELIGGSSSVT